MAKVQIKSEKSTPLGGIFSIMELFDTKLSSATDSSLDLKRKLYGLSISSAENSDPSILG